MSENIEENKQASPEEDDEDNLGSSYIREYIGKSMSMSCCSSKINASGCDGEEVEEEERGREKGCFVK